MTIKYIVGKYELTCGQIRKIKSSEFSSVEEAIEFHKDQEDGAFSWWEITVEYT